MPEPVENAPAPSVHAYKPQLTIARWFIETVVLVAVAFALAQGIRAYVGEPYVIPTGSMVPTIAVGDRVFAEKVTLRFSREARSGDIVVFSDPDARHPQLIKRVIATQGQTVDIRDGSVMVDGKRLEEPYTRGKRTMPGTVVTPIVIPDGHVWLMGDNRPNSGDSRYFGPQPVSAIRGRAFWTYWPLRAFGALD